MKDVKISIAGEKGSQLSRWVKAFYLEESMSASQEQVINILEIRFDYQSARSVWNNFRKHVQIKGEIGELNDDQLRQLVAYLEHEVPDALRSIALLRGLILGGESEVENRLEDEGHHEKVVVEEKLEDAVVQAETKVEKKDKKKKK